MAEVTRLTRAGQFAEATALLQHTLGACQLRQNGLRLVDQRDLLPAAQPFFLPGAW